MSSVHTRLSTRRGIGPAPVALLAALLCACSGNISDEGAEDDEPTAGSPTPGAPNGPAATGGGPTAPSAPSATGPVDPGPRPLRRLTNLQYANTVRAVLGVDMHLEALLGNDRSLEGFSNGAHQAAPSVGLSQGYAAAAQALAERATAPGARARLFDASACGDQAACLGAFVRTHGRRLFRRPLADEELGAILTGAREEARLAGDFWAGARHALEVMLQAVPFLYIVESGERDPARPGLLRRDPYALATRLALLLWNSGPDDELLDAAARGALRDRAELAQRVARMLESRRAAEAGRHFFREWLGYDLASRATKDPVHADFKPELVSALVAETDRMVDRFTAGGAAMDIFRADLAVTDERVKRFYGASAAERGGVLGHASFIAANSGPGNPSPTLRGLGVLTRFLCGQVASPPPNAPTELPESADKVPRTIRERTELYMLANNGCNYCHNNMDRVGFLFERFDVIGKHRTVEPVPGAPGGVKPVDATGAIPALGLDRVDGLPGLAAALGTHEVARRCLVTHVLRWGLGRDDEESDAPLVAALDESYRRNGGSFRAVLAALATSDAFLYIREAR